MGKRITATTVKNIKPGEIVWDGVVAGFGLRCQGRAKRYILKARARGRQIWFRIGDVGAFTPDQARREASWRLRELSHGVDPEMLRQNPAGLLTVEDLATRYTEEHVDHHNRPSTAKEFKRLLNLHILPEIGKRAITEVNSADIAALHHEMRETPASANQALAVVSRMFSLAERWQLRPLGTNPARRVQKFRMEPRTRFLSDAELQKLGETLAALEKARARKGAIQPGLALAIRLLALTGCRASEILNLRWDDVDLGAAVLNIAHAKAGARQHTVGATVVALLKALDRAGAYVCWINSDPDKPIPLSRLEAAWRRIREHAGLADARIHDMRHTVGTAAGGAQASAFLVRDLLGHRSIQMTGRYVNRAPDPLKRLADSVSKRIGAALAGVQANAKARRKKRAGKAKARS